jgi:hypothetical protein
MLYQLAAMTCCSRETRAVNSVCFAGALGEEITRETVGKEQVLVERDELEKILHQEVRVSL